MNLNDFDYQLPRELIAIYPAERRDESRLMVVDRETQSISHHIFHEVVNLLPQPGILVRNNTRVFPARLRGHKNPDGGRVEVLLIKLIEPNVFEAMVRPARRLKKGQKIDFGELTGTIIKKLEGGTRLIEFNCPDLMAKLTDLGEIPLPPYINRKTAGIDADRYQTVYADKSGSVAAPTAGLHFTPEILNKLRKNQVEIADVTLHVGPGTFKPVKSENIIEHKMDYEEYSVTGDNWRKIKNSQAPLTAVGTTSVRTIETILSNETPKLSGMTNLFITPGYRFKRVDHLLTNFHLPRSTLLMLVAAFAGLELTRKAYQVAVEEKYRFYSYGDAMLIL